MSIGAAKHPAMLGHEEDVIHYSLFATRSLEHRFQPDIAVHSWPLITVDRLFEVLDDRSGVLVGLGLTAKIASDRL